MTDSAALSLQVNDGVGRITMVRPDRGDPIDATFCRELREVVDDLAADPSIRVVAIRSTGPHFSVGGDVKTFRSLGDSLPAYVRSATADAGVAMSRLVALAVPVVVEVRGVTAGGAVALVAAADVAIAGSSATFFAAFTGIGLSPDMGTTHLVSRRVGSRHASDFYLLNRTWTADVALDRGLVSMVVADELVSSTTESTVAALAAGPTIALGETKRLLWRTWEHSLETQLEHEARAITALAATSDASEGLAALGDRRPPVFHGR